ncbi:MAG: fenitrothion hydrolase [Pseudomonadota bacterium]
MIPSLPLAHGIGAIRDLPVPMWLFYYGAGAALIVSFIALGALWKRPVLEHYRDGRPLPPWAQRMLLGPELRILCGAIGFGLLVLVLLTGAFGEYSSATNLAPTFVYVVFWLGFVPVVVLLGNVWSVFSPWKAAADAVAWLGDRLGVDFPAASTYPEGLGRWPAAFGLFAFATLELCYPNSASPRAVALAVAIYSWVTWVGMALYGREAWHRRGEAFNVYFGLLGRIAPFAVLDRDGERVVVARVPLSGLSGADRIPGTVAFLTVMLGSVAFDGFSRTTWWVDRLFELESRVVTDSVLLSDLVTTAANLAGLIAAILVVAGIYLLAVAGARATTHRREGLRYDFALSLVPIALAYAVAHYFSLLVLQGQSAWFMASDPFGFGWNLFGTAGFEPNLTALKPNEIWYVQVAALVAGHVLGLVLAHDRAVSIFRSARAALRTQYAMLVLMIAYTVGGLWLLSNG